MACRLRSASWIRRRSSAISALTRLFFSAARSADSSTEHLRHHPDHLTSGECVTCPHLGQMMDSRRLMPRREAWTFTDAGVLPSASAMDRDPSPAWSLRYASSRRVHRAAKRYRLGLPCATHSR